MLICSSGSRGDGQQRRVAVPAGDWENQEPVLPQPDVGDEHREENGPQQQERGWCKDDKRGSVQSCVLVKSLAAELRTLYGPLTCFWFRSEEIKSIYNTSCVFKKKKKCWILFWTLRRWSKHEQAQWFVAKNCSQTTHQDLQLQAVPLCAAGWHESFYCPVRVQLKKISWWPFLMSGKLSFLWSAYHQHRNERKMCPWRKNAQGKRVIKARYTPGFYS